MRKNGKREGERTKHKKLGSGVLEEKQTAKDESDDNGVHYHQTHHSD